MNKGIFTLLAVVFFSVCSNMISAQTIWKGDKITFTKSDSADWTLEANQDRITDSVWITRAHIQSLFNIAKETKYEKYFSPAGTEWAFGNTDHIDTMHFNNFQTANNGNPASMIDKEMVLHLISEDIYIDIKFISFTGSNGGGGFSYERSTKSSVSVPVVNSEKTISLYPNPAVDFISFTGIKKQQCIAIYNAFGQSVFSGTIQPNELIDIQSFAKGIYWVVLEENSVLRFVKN
ncbi:MAG: T9SS type A sorting domain-containing protein [Bacteroidetes bacterium]|nr:T9SS type A sorting domain-containing protein [Bacteroidota bacterium]